MCLGGCLVLTLEIMLTSTHERSEYISVLADLRSPPNDVGALLASWVERILPSVTVSRVKCTAFHRERGQIPIPRDRIPDCTDPSISDAASIAVFVFDRTRSHDKLDYAACFEYEADPVASGRELPAHVLLAVRVSSMAGPTRTGRSPNLGPCSLAECVVPLLEEIGRTADAVSGLIEISDCWDSGFGRIHGASTIGYAPFQRQLARKVWIEGDDYEKVRGVFWGNWLGTRQLARLGGVSSFVTAYRAREDPRDHDLVRNQPNGSVLVLLSGEPEDMLFPFHRLTPNTLSRANWLFREFGKARLLPGM